MKDVKLGDVVIATKIYNYEVGKVVDGKFLTRPQAFTSGPKVLAQARIVSRQYGVEKGFTVHLGPNAT